MKNKKKTLQTQRTSSRHRTPVRPSGALRGDAKNGAPTPDSRPPILSCTARHQCSNCSLRPRRTKIRAQSEWYFSASSVCTNRLRTPGPFAIIQVTSSSLWVTMVRELIRRFLSKNVSIQSGTRQTMQRSDIDPEFLKKRLEQIAEGLQEGIRREVERLKRLGLPIYVEQHGKIIDLQKNPRKQPE